MTERPANRLAGETSPYLLQHAHNPVEWYPWGPEALAKARLEDKPIFLSIGYSAGHWCHVMERESFEDPEIAALMNERFVSIKVDREERPDLDGIYMDAVQAMNGQGGWPLSAFLTPAGEPFFAGTYFPPVPAHGMPSFRQVLMGIAQTWRERRGDVEAQGRQVTQMIARAAQLRPTEDPLNAGIAEQAVETLGRAFDPMWGGFGGAPKFPQPMTLEFLLRQGLREVPGAMEMLPVTLDHMAAGGMYDHVGGGFARYATDTAWHVPHFEKMLYDNAQLLQLYTRAWQVSGNGRYREVASATADYLLREMQHPQGGFWSSQDADSEGVEGKFYAWTWDQLVALVGEPVATCFGASAKGNWEGTNVLWRPVEIADVAARLGLDADALAAQCAEARRTLFEARDARVRPGTDDKVLAAWNGMAIRALAEAGRAFAEPTYTRAAVDGADFILRELRDDEGQLRRSWRDGVRGGPAFADDHALMAMACLTLYETTYETRWFLEARGLAENLIERFHDRTNGGFFQTASDAAALLVRPKELYDNATPSGNSVAAEVLQRLSLVSGDRSFEETALSALQLVAAGMARAPSGFGQALCALDLYLGPSREVAVVGDPLAEATRALAEEVTVARFRPNVVLAVGSPDDADPVVALLVDRALVDGRAAAYVCERFACKLPVTEGAALRAELDATPGTLVP